MPGARSPSIVRSPATPVAREMGARSEALTSNMIRPETTGLRRLTVLFSRLSGYMATCLQTLHEQHGVALQVFRHPPVGDAPFDERHFEWIGALYDRPNVDRSRMLAIVQEFEPDAVFVSGWFDRDYLSVCSQLKAQGVPVVAGSDAQWTGSARQQVGRLIAPWYLHRAIDVMWVSGERQRLYAGKLGFDGPKCWTGCYACDWDRFSSVYARRSTPGAKGFLFVGRYVPVKGLSVLLEAYRTYRSMVRSPWPLICAGTGPQQSLLEGQEGVIDHGFVQPDELPALMESASAFVLASNREPWGVVVQEAAATGLPLICSEACGAAVHLLQDGYNGYVFGTGDSRHLAQCMVRMSDAPEDELARMGEGSFELSRQFTPERWARTLIQGVGTLGAYQS